MMLKCRKYGSVASAEKVSSSPWNTKIYSYYVAAGRYAPEYGSQGTTYNANQPPV